MSLLYKPDWEETKQNYIAWWNHEYFGRAAIAVTAPKDNAPTIERPKLPEGVDNEERHSNIEYIKARNRYWLERTYFGGEAIPTWFGNGYPGNISIPAFVGCPLGFQNDTVWWYQLLEGDDLDVSKLKIDPNNKWWRFGLELQKIGIEEARGKAIPGIVGAFGGCGDTLAALRGSEQLLFDCVERPDDVRKAELLLMDQWFEVYDTFYNLAYKTAEGSNTWFGTWSPGKNYAGQNDFSFNISPKMFRDIFIPALEKQMDFLDHSIYHLDGVNAFVHLPALLELDKLNGVQVGPGAGQPSPIHFLDTCRAVQAAGKNLHITIAPEEVPEALSLLHATGLFIATWADSEQEAKDLIKLAERESKP
jgi:hypothetical protein